jgi:hypothetical protein
MMNTMDEPEYKSSKEDILTMLHILRMKLPEYATPENAIKLLNYQHQYHKNIEEIDPEETERILKDLEEN